MSRWFRLYDDMLDDPKAQRLPAPLFKTWINLLCLASKNNGAIPCLDDAAFALRTTPDALQVAIADLVDRGLVDSGDDGMAPHNWDARQFKSDRDETANERQKRKRERDKAETVTRDVTDKSRPPEAEAEAEAERTDARAKDHREVAEDILKATDFPISSWEDGFLSNIVLLTHLTPEQTLAFEPIAKRWLNKQPNAPPPPPMFAVTEGSEAWMAWLKAKRKRSMPTTDLPTGKRGWYFPSEFPSQEASA